MVACYHSRQRMIEGQKRLIELHNLNEAVDYFHERTNHAGYSAGQISGQFGVMARVFIIKMPNPENGLGVNRRFHVYFKRDWLFKGDQLFNIKTGGYWQSLNLDGLKRAALENAIIVIIMKYGGFYTVEAQDWLRYAVGNKTIRRPSTEASSEASIPRYLLEERIAEAEPEPVRI